MKGKFLAAFFLLSSTIFFTNSYAKQTEIADDNAVLEYRSEGRGSKQEVLIQKNKIFTKTRDLAIYNQKEAVISQKDWEELIALLHKIDIKKIPSFKAPTDERALDGAQYAYFKVIYQNKTYETKDFDNGHPPLEIEELIKKITSLESHN